MQYPYPHFTYIYNSFIIFRGTRSFLFGKGKDGGELGAGGGVGGGVGGVGHHGSHELVNGDASAYSKSPGIYYSYHLF